MLMGQPPELRNCFSSQVNHAEVMWVGKIPCPISKDTAFYGIFRGEAVQVSCSTLRFSVPVKAEQTFQDAQCY